MSEKVKEAVVKIMALPGFPFGGPMFAADLCDFDEDGEPQNDTWGKEAREIIAHCVNFVCEHAQDYAALLAERDALLFANATLRSDAERFTTCPWRVQKGATALCQPPRKTTAAETELARLRGQGEALVAKWRGECDELRKCGPDEYLDGRMYELEACADEQAAAMSTTQESSNG